MRDEAFWRRFKVLEQQTETLRQNDLKGAQTIAAAIRNLDKVMGLHTDPWERPQYQRTILGIRQFLERKIPRSQWSTVLQGLGTSNPSITQGVGGRAARTRMTGNATAEQRRWALEQAGQGKTDKEIADQLLVTEGTVARWRVAAGMRKGTIGKATAEQKKLALEQVGQGKTDKEIADQLPVTEATVANWRRAAERSTRTTGRATAEQREWALEQADQGKTDNGVSPNLRTGVN